MKVVEMSEPPEGPESEDRVGSQQHSELGMEGVAAVDAEVWWRLKATAEMETTFVQPPSATRTPGPDSTLAYQARP